MYREIGNVNKHEAYALFLAVAESLVAKTNRTRSETGCGREILECPLEKNIVEDEVSLR